ncbi:MAG: phosphoribosyltransferase [Chloroflexi bacterium]|nr:phosphoribosyltransferase [Chloroflexota bacterium]
MGKVRIVSTRGEPFTDREEAGRLLAEELSEYRGKNVVVLGIPRGGVVVARELARALDAELDIVLARKLRTPGYEELAMGSVAEDGKIFLNQEVVADVGVSQSQIQEEKARQLAEIRRRAELIRRVRAKIPLKGRIVIVTDDGVATGATTQAAFWGARAEQPAKLVAAIPVGPEDTIRRLAKDVDEMICLRTPPFFSAVGQFYQRFYQVEDEEVLEILSGLAKKEPVK